MLKTGAVGYVFVALALGALLCSLLRKRILTYITTTILTTYTLFLLLITIYRTYIYAGISIGTGSYIAIIGIILSCFCFLGEKLLFMS
ncbi:MAG: hypothetical protein LBE76_06885 [Nitrososphaerota archaeon]|nr:hypothetical protein [Nitrososphaerota archaeon]